MNALSESNVDGDRTVWWRLHLVSPPPAVFEFLSTNQGRARFWAESAIETDGVIDFVFPGGETWRGRVLESLTDRRYKIEYYGGTITTFMLEPDGEGGTELVLRDEGVAASEVVDVEAGWVSVLMALKAAADHGVDLRNHRPERSYRRKYADN